MVVTATMRYTVKTRMYDCVELIVLDNGEWCYGDVIEELGFEFGKARSRFYRMTGK